MFCEYCGAKIDFDSTFCENCGEKVASTMPPRPLCPGCGEEFEEGDKFCYFCSTKLPDKAENYIENVAPTPPKPLCPGCGEEFEEGDRFCYYCSADLLPEQTPIAAPPPQPIPVVAPPPEPIPVVAPEPVQAPPAQETAAVKKLSTASKVMAGAAIALAVAFGYLQIFGGNMAFWLALPLRQTLDGIETAFFTASIVALIVVTAIIVRSLIKKRA
ncbi:MAG: zinc ribbon domain-containing protein [Clostridiales bacterium]|jgi:hypothetical protein|nr:zinc ribbon domain-containing protein [Clostridiales bacterium]